MPLGPNKWPLPSPSWRTDEWCLTPLSVSRPPPVQQAALWLYLQNIHRSTHLRLQLLHAGAGHHPLPAECWHFKPPYFHSCASTVPFPYSIQSIFQKCKLLLRDSSLQWLPLHLEGFPGGIVVKNPCQCRRHGFNPRVRKISWRRKWQPTPVFLPGKFLRQRSLSGYSPSGHKELGRTEHTSYLEKLVSLCPCFSDLASRTSLHATPAFIYRILAVRSSFPAETGQAHFYAGLLHYLLALVLTWLTLLVSLQLQRLLFRLSNLVWRHCILIVCVALLTLWRSWLWGFLNIFFSSPAPRKQAPRGQALLSCSLLLPQLQNSAWPVGGAAWMLADEWMKQSAVWWICRVSGALGAPHLWWRMDWPNFRGVEWKPFSWEGGSLSEDHGLPWWLKW